MTSTYTKSRKKSPFEAEPSASETLFAAWRSALPPEQEKEIKSVEPPSALFRTTTVWIAILKRKGEEVIRVAHVDFEGCLTEYCEQWKRGGYLTSQPVESIEREGPNHVIKGSGIVISRPTLEKAVNDFVFEYVELIKS